MARATGEVIEILPCSMIRLVGTDEPVRDDLAAVHVFELDEGAEFHPVATELGSVDDVGARESVLDLGDACLAHPLLVFGRVVFGVLLEITVVAGDSNLLGDLRPLGLERR